MNLHIYADNAATTKLDEAVFEGMKPWLIEEYGNVSQPYAFSRNPKKSLTDARVTIAACINALPEEIYFTSGGTESNNWAIKSSAIAMNGRRTITSSFEHHSILNSCRALDHLGYKVKYIEPTSEGIITPEILYKNINDQTGIVSVMFANNEIGSIQPIKKLCEISHTNKALFHTDAVQAVGHIKIDVNELGVDMLSASAHKFNGPKGVGFLYIRKGVELLPFLDGGAQEHGYRAGTENIASIVGMATALQINCEELEYNEKYVNGLTQEFLDLLSTSGIEYVRNGGQNTLPGLMSLSFPGADGEAILHRMDLMGISISTGSACDSVNTEISHVLRAIRLDESLAKGTIRISLGKNNTMEEVEQIVAALKKILL